MKIFLTLYLCVLYCKYPILRDERFLGREEDKCSLAKEL